MVKPIQERKTQSTLLIPSQFLDDYLSKTSESGRENYFHLLIRRYAPLVKAGVFGERKSVKIRYQKKDNNLIRKNFRPMNTDWIEFTMLADYLGVSKTDLFTMFLKLDISDWPVILRENWYADGVPPTISNITSRIHLTNMIPIRVFRKIRYKTRFL